MVTKEIRLEIPIPPNVSLGDSLYFEANLDYFSVNDNSPGFSLPFHYPTEVRCSFDPNDKLVNPNREDNLTLIDQDLIYTIRFQNTGNDEAYDIVVRDTLDPNLDPTTFRVLSTSHPNSLITTLEDNQFLNFNFENIYLPDSTTNFEESQGYVSYLIRSMENLPSETSIQNTASIYFDFNPPIVTNTTDNIIVYDNDMDGFWSNVDCDDDDATINPNAEEIPNNGIDEDCTGTDLMVGTTELNGEKIDVYPNPVADFLFVKKETSKTYLFEIVDVTGKIISNGKINDSIYPIPFTKMNAGVYFIKIIHPQTKQFIVEKIVK